jgi:gamma-glutamylcyclotransferase (GGCT)/AIG2-like uncharacterized protein YtfP
MDLPLFVYGTLLASARHPLGDHLRTHSHALGPARLRGRLYLITDPDDPTNAYPGAIPTADPADAVHGELYALTGDVPALLATLDAFEACSPEWPEPHEFLRRRVEVVEARGRCTPAIAYLYTWDVASARHIPSGCFTGSGALIR